jgi:hypothetical protein
MPFHLPATKPDIQPNRFFRDRPIVSGENVADVELGVRVLHSAENHAYSVRVSPIGESSKFGFGALFSENISAGVQTLAGPWSIEIGADIVQLQADIWASHGTVYLVVDDGTGPITSPGTALGALGTASEAITLVDQTGVTVLVRLDYVRTGGQTFALYGYQASEVALTAVQIPA